MSDTGNDEIRKKFVHEIKALIEKGIPEPSEDWDVVWVLSGVETGIDSPPVDSTGSQEKERLECAFRIVREVAALREGKKVEELTPDHIRVRGPILYFNGRYDQINDLSDMIERGDIEKRYGIPRESIRFSDNPHLRNTRDQVFDIPSRLLQEARRVIVVSSLHHMPRIARYMQSRFPDTSYPPEKIILYSSSEDVLPKRSAGEIQRIAEYEDTGDLPPESEFEKGYASLFRN